MKFKEYEMPDGKKAVFEYDENGVGKITLECMDMLMGFINDRKTENSSEKPNNSTISKMEQVDKDINVRSKDEPQINASQHVQHVESVETMSCQECRRWIYDDRWGWFCPLKGQDECKYEPKNEPQTDNLFTDKYGDVWEWRGNAWYCISGDEPQTERSE